MVRKIFHGEMLSEHYQQLSLKYFVKSFSIRKLLLKAQEFQTTISGGTL